MYKKIKVMTGGAFDMFHYAHLLFLEECSKYGDVLIVQVNSDARIKAKKGESRPIIPEDERCRIIEALGIVDDVICLRGDAEYPVFKTCELIQPDVLVLNSDEFGNYDKEIDYCKANGIKLVFVPRIIAPSGLDTTKIVAKIKG